MVDRHTRKVEKTTGSVPPILPRTRPPGFVGYVTDLCWLVWISTIPITRSQPGAVGDRQL